MIVDAEVVVELEAELAREHALLGRLERIRRTARELGALGTPGLDRNIAETVASIAELERRLGRRAGES